MSALIDVIEDSSGKKMTDDDLTALAEAVGVLEADTGPHWLVTVGTAILTVLASWVLMVMVLLMEVQA